MIVHHGSYDLTVVDHTQTRGIPREPARSIGGSVEGIKHGQRSIARFETALLAEHPQAGIVQHDEGSVVGDHVAGVLIGPQT